MGKKVMFFHTTLGTPVMTKRLFMERYPDHELVNMVDDSILPEVAANGGVPTPFVVRRLVEYGSLAEQMGADVCVCMCTTLGLAVREASKAMSIPFLTIDGPMLSTAPTVGKRMALLATASTTVKISGMTARTLADEVGCADTVIDTIFIPNAFDALNKELDQAKHDRLVVEAIEKAAEDHDVIVLAQVTMADLPSKVPNCKVPIFTSPKSGLEQLKPWLDT